MVVRFWFLLAGAARRTVAGVAGSRRFARPADRLGLNRRRIGFEQRRLAFHDGLLFVLFLFDMLFGGRLRDSGRIKFGAEINHQAFLFIRLHAHN